MLFKTKQQPFMFKMTGKFLLVLQINVRTFYYMGFICAGIGGRKNTYQ